MMRRGNNTSNIHESTVSRRVYACGMRGEAETSSGVGRAVQVICLSPASRSSFAAAGLMMKLLMHVSSLLCLFLAVSRPGVVMEDVMLEICVYITRFLPSRRSPRGYLHPLLRRRLQRQSLPSFECPPFIEIINLPPAQHRQPSILFPPYSKVEGKTHPALAAIHLVPFLLHPAQRLPSRPRWGLGLLPSLDDPVPGEAGAVGVS